MAPSLPGGRFHLRTPVATATVSLAKGPGEAQDAEARAVAVSEDEDPDDGGDDAEHRAGDPDDDRHPGVIAARLAALGLDAEDPARDRGRQREDEQRAHREHEQPEAGGAERQRG